MKKSKAILMALCAVLLVAASVMGTLAYLTSTDSVTNTFTVGNVKITLDEAKVGDDGKALTGESAVRVKENTYKLMPGHEYDKDPTIHVDALSQDCFLFVKVENGIVGIEADTTIAAQMTEKGWAKVDGVNNVYVYIGLKEGATAPLAVAASTDVPVFESFTISGTVTNDDLAGTPDATDPDNPDEIISGKPGYKDAKIVVTAYAVQADGFADKAADVIWADAGFK